MTTNEKNLIPYPNDCQVEFSLDPNFSDTCGSEITCASCYSCSEHCPCERKPNLDRARAITANLIEELRALKTPEPTDSWPSPDASREERAAFYGEESR